MLLTEITFSDATKRTIKIAQAVAKEYLHPDLTPAHLLKALLHKDVALLPLLKQLNKDIFYLEEWADVRLEALAKSSRLSEAPSANLALQDVFNEADNIRLQLNKGEIEPLHLLAAVVTPGVGFSFEQIKSLPLKRDEFINTEKEAAAIQNLLGGKSQNGTGASSTATGNALLTYCTDKSLLAKEGKLDAIIGRDKEIRMMAEILCRRSKPNVLIVGEPGVGKSALVDGFTLAVMEGKVPSLLSNAQVFELNTGSLIAGASYKGEIEDRLKNIIAEIKGLEKAILFIDEIHALIDKQGSAAGAVNLLKPELARGEITVIGATTMDEYRKFIEKDEALNRRFELLMVEEPDSTVAFQMLKKVMPYYETHHGIRIPDDTIKETIRLAKRYTKDKRLPDSAIDLADRSMAALRIINDTGASSIEGLKKEFEEWCKTEDANVHSLEEWQWFYRQASQKISPILWSYHQSEKEPGKMTATEEIKSYLSEALAVLEGAVVDKHEELSKANVAAIVAYKTGIPIGKVQAAEKERLLNMEDILKARVVGQEAAIKAISEAILESRSGLGKPGQPIGSFFFLGPTGTGKTELAKALAEFLFQDESFLIRFDMSEFKEEHSAALLYGAPPGYVGYEEGGLLVNKIRQKPYSVVLFDEIEKAHASVFDLFLQIMDEGKLHDKLGKEGDFSNAVIIFTSNIGSSFIVDEFNEGKVPTSQTLLDIMSKHFRLEFLGRITEIVPFAPMTQEMVQRILNIQTKSLFTSLEKLGVGLEISAGAEKVLAKMGFVPEYGARPLNGVIRQQLRRPLSRKIINGEVKAGDVVYVDADAENNLQWRIQSSQNDG